MPTLASSSLVVVRAIKETVFGTTPGAGNPTVLRVTGETFEYGIQKEVSKEINAARGVSAMIPVDASPTGGIQGELSHKTFDMFIESVMQSTYVVMGTTGATAATATSNITATTITASAATTGNDLWTKLQQGQWFRISSAGANNGKILRVSTVTAPTATVITLDTNTPATVSAGESITIQSSRLTHGTTQTSFTIERHNTDIGAFIAYRGMTPSKMSIQIQSGSLTSISFDFMGKDATDAAATTLPGTPVVPTLYDIHSGVFGATQAIWLDGAPLTATYVKSVQLDFDNALREQAAIGTLGSVGIGAGTINATLQLSIYFADRTTFTKFRTNANSALIFSSTDAAGNGYIFTVPVASMTSWKSNASAKDQDEMIDIQFQLLLDSGNATPALQRLLFIDRVGAVL